MTQILVVNDWFANRVMQKTIQIFTIDNIGFEKDIEFEIMALTQSMIDKVKSCDSHKEMLFLAADSGIVFDGTRAIASKDLTVDDIAALWGDESLDIDCDPCIRARVGERVCEISGLAEMLEEVIALEAELAEEEEAAALIKVGDHELPGDTLIDNLNQESLDNDALLNANA